MKRFGVFSFLRGVYALPPPSYMFEENFSVFLFFDLY